MDLLTVSEAVERSGYTPQHIRLLLRDKVVHGRRAGGVWLLDVASLDAYLKSNPHRGPKPTVSKG